MTKIRLGKGLAWRTLDDDSPIYSRKLTVAEIQARIAHCWQPQHAAVASAIDAAHAQNGYSMYINCCFLPAVASSQATGFSGKKHVEFVMGDRDGTTAHPALSALVCLLVKSLGYSVAYNHRYKGVELVRRYSHPASPPASGTAFSWKLIASCSWKKKLAISAGFEPLKVHLQSLVAVLLQTDPRQLQAPRQTKASKLIAEQFANALSQRVLL